MKLRNDFEFENGPADAIAEDCDVIDFGSRSAVATRPSHLLYFPDFTPTNPYQHALYAAFPEDWDARPGTLEEAARLAATGEDVLFHLHWPEMLFAGCDTTDRFTHRAHLVFAWLRYLRRAGGRSVWTAHNAMPHDSSNIERQIWFHHELAKLVDAIHVHDAEARDSLGTLYAIARDRIFVVPHGTTPKPPPERAAKVLARVGLGLQPNSTVVAFLGQLRAYKGIERLVAAYQLVRERRSDIELLISGKPVPVSLEGRWARVGQTLAGVVVREGFMSDEMLATCLSAADAIVLPYEAVLCSGTAHLAMEHGVPLIVPDLIALRAFSRAGAALSFEGMDVRSLAEAIERFADLPADDRTALSTSALRLAGTRTWPIVGAAMARHLRRVVPQAEFALPAAPADEAQNANLLSLRHLYERAYGLARVTGLKPPQGEPWTALLPAALLQRHDTLRCVAERALRSGWIDGCDGFPNTPDVDVADRIDAAGALPGESDLCGYVERVDLHHVVGWAASAITAGAGGPQDWEGAGSVWLCENDVPVVELSTHIDRPDVQAFGMALTSGFDVVIERSRLRPLSGRIEIRSGRNGKRIGDGFLAAEPADRARDEPFPMTSEPEVRAYVDLLTDGVLCGWARDLGEVNRAVFLDVEIDNVLYRDVPATAFREDLALAGIGNGRHAFELVVPVALSQRPEVHVRIFENGRATVLLDTVVRHSDTSTYRTDFSPDAYLRWSYVHGMVPIGLFAQSSAVRAWFDINRQLLTQPREAKVPCIDIIMPVYNRRGVVGRAIASVLAQSHADWRLIIVDDASLDGTAEALATLVRDLDDARITLISLPAHAGVSQARNAGLEHGEAELVAYLDSDNEWHRDFLHVMGGVMDDMPEVKACYCGQEVWQKPAGASEAELRTARASPFNRSALERCNTIDLNAFVHRRSLYETLGGFHRDLHRLVDWELILRYTEAQPAHFVPALLSQYHLDAASNRISCIEPVAEAEVLIAGERPDLLEPMPEAIETPTAPVAPLDILLIAGTLAEAQAWLTLNLAWIDPQRDQLWYVSKSEGYGTRARMQIAGVDAEDADDGDRDVLVTSAEWSARADWRAVVARNHGMDTATGRLVDIEAGDGRPHYVDLAPAKIADQIRSWSVAHRNAVACAALPSDFLWISHRHAARLRIVLDSVATTDEALRQFQMGDITTPTKWVNLYLPDLIAFRGHGPGRERQRSEPSV